MKSWTEFPIIWNYIFEEICTEYLWRQAKNHSLLSSDYRQMVGHNPIRKQQDNIDILALDKGKEGLFCSVNSGTALCPWKEYDEI